MLKKAVGCALLLLLTLESCSFADRDADGTGPIAPPETAPSVTLPAETVPSGTEPGESAPADTWPVGTSHEMLPPTVPVGAQTAPIGTDPSETVPIAVPDEPAQPAFRSEGQPFGEIFGISRESVVDWLLQHETDEYYLGTPYRRGIHAFPQGDANYSFLSDAEKAASVEAAVYLPANSPASPGYSSANRHSPGEPAMNCGGFVTQVLESVSPGFSKAFLRAIAVRPLSLQTRAGGACNVFNWQALVTGGLDRSLKGDRQTEYRYYRFDRVEDMLASGLLKKGDIVMSVPQTETGDYHIGFYWGDTGSEDRYWHSVKPENVISGIRACAKNVVWYIIPLGD